MLRVETRNDAVTVFLGDLPILRHSAQQPLLEFGKADFHFTHTGGGLSRIHNAVSGWVRPRGCAVQENSLRLFEGETQVEITLEPGEDGFCLSCKLPEGFSYARLNILAERDEAVYGGGVQFGSLNLRGRRFPMWTMEMGLGRHPLRPYTWLANWIAGAGGEYWNTYFPQPSFLSTRGYGCLVDTGGYSQLDFSGKTRHAVELLDSGRVHFFIGEGLSGVLGRLAARVGIMPEPPHWVFEGGILGIQGGLPYVRETVERVVAAGAKLTGVWTQDWTGVRVFWQGKRLFWNWTVNTELYPGLQEEIRRCAGQGVRWLAYLNPYFNSEGEQFQFARKEGYLVKDERGEALVHPVAGFQTGILDLTNPVARRWYQETVIQQNLLGLGVRGWMADYGEDIPEQARFFDGRTGREMHNLYPLLWAQMNREAVEAAGLQDDVLIFHRAGYTGATRSMDMHWGGDQVVYWNRHDGLPAGITGGLSACLSGVQYSHTDAGGYFSFRWIKRSKEVLLRWCEANAFSPVLRTHEGNRPWAGVQPWQDTETLEHFARATRWHALLAPYLAHVSAEAQTSGVGMLRPLCLLDPAPRWRSKSDAYSLGNDLLVYPVLRPGVTRMTVDLPSGEWVHVFRGTRYEAGLARVECPPGQPAVFYRAETAFLDVFEGLRRA